MKLYIAMEKVAPAPLKIMKQWLSNAMAECIKNTGDVVSSLVRETYMFLFADNDYLTDFASQIGAETEPPIIGILEPESVIESTYFFC